MIGAQNNPHSSCTGCTIVAILLLSSGQSALAAQPEPLHKLGLCLGTDVPVMIGGELEWAPTRYLVPSISLGFLPGGYVDVINAFVGDEPIEALIKGSIQSSLAFRLNLRTYPWRAWGFYAGFSYLLYTLGGGVNVADYLTAAGFNPPAGSRLEQITVPARSTVHLLSVGIGYRFWIIERLSLTLETSFLFAVGSSTAVEAAAERLEQGVDAFLNEIYLTYIKAPIIGVRLGYHLF